MKVMNHFHKADLAMPDQFLSLNRYGPETAFKTELLIEHDLDVYMGGEHIMRITCTPEHLAELVLGRLLTEGTIHSVNDVDQIYISENGKRAVVTLCKAYVKSTRLQPIISRSWDISDVFLCAERFAEDTELHMRTRSTHSCFLVSDGRIVFECEDMSRHNTVDKAVGWAVMHRVNLTSAAVFTSGRVPMDMAVKMIHARVPVLISKECATADAVDIARRFGLTVIGRARKDSFVVFSDGSKQQSLLDIV